MYLRFHITFLWRGSAFSKYSPSEHHNIPRGTTGWDSALSFGNYLFSPDISIKDNRNVAARFSFNWVILHFYFSKTLLKHRPLPPLHYNFPSEKFPPGSPLFSVIHHFSLIPLTPPPLLWCQEAARVVQQQWHPDDWNHGTERWKAFWDRCRSESREQQQPTACEGPTAASSVKLLK